MTFFLHYKYQYGTVYYFVLSLNYAKKSIKKTLFDRKQWPICFSLEHKITIEKHPTFINLIKYKNLFKTIIVYEMKNEIITLTED